MSRARAQAQPTRIQPARNATSSLNGLESQISEVTLVDPEEEKKQKRLTKQESTLQKCLANVSETQGLTHDILMRCGQLNSVQQLLSVGADSLEDAALNQIKAEWKATKHDDIVAILRRVVLCKENYQPRTASNIGTDPSLISSHNTLAEALVSFLEGSWMIFRIFRNISRPALDDSNYCATVIMPCVVDLHKLAKFVHCSVKRNLLRLLVGLWAHLTAMFNGPFYNEIMREIYKLFSTCEDYAQQLQLCVMMGFLCQKSVTIVRAIGYKVGLRMWLKDFVSIFRNCSPTDSPIPNFAYEAVNFTNERRGIHRKVFSFRLNTPCYASSDQSDFPPVPVYNPFISNDEAPDQWCLSFSLGSQTMCFELEGTAGRFFVWIPFDDIVVVDVSSEHDSVILQMIFTKALSEYYDGNCANVINPVGFCDTVSFHLGGALANLGLLEKALQRCFGHRCGTATFHGEWNVPELGKTNNPFYRIKKSLGVVAEASDKIDENDACVLVRETIVERRFAGEKKVEGKRSRAQSQASTSADVSCVEISSDDKPTAQRNSNPEITTPTISPSKSVILDDCESAALSPIQPNDLAPSDDDDCISPAGVLHLPDTDLTSQEFEDMLHSSRGGMSINVNGQSLVCTPMKGVNAPITVTSVCQPAAVSTSNRANRDRLPLEQISNEANAMEAGKRLRSRTTGNSSTQSISADVVTLD
ncbi:uncharacterized protein LOC129581596 [Paramacrobiotus metropolitanus]|uniref:uncharacterized protein LOC129581596 n=1 Tax=Paramacrobiotus metropolitanus TaxID=2943436 RepID=UPI0024457A83|nr:uncharacterized protein LOC129581596 [Paramacrobiotus metropolitanus]XP_055328750.1 uncharacterized protein LOC129581596 [Paramacrobiotus metropolitanus]